MKGVRSIAALQELLGRKLRITPHAVFLHVFVVLIMACCLPRAKCFVSGLLHEENVEPLFDFRVLHAADMLLTDFA